MIDKQDSCKQAALRYAGQRWPVFPVVSTVKVPRVKDWRNAAITDPQQIETWWTERPNDSVGIVTGERSGLFVLDVDGEEGSASLAALEATNSPLPQTRTVSTARGRHLYFQRPAKTRIPCSAGRIGNGLDIRGDGGFIIAPPSLHASGKRYGWVDESVPVAAAPDWLLSLVTAEDVSGEVIPMGTRNDTLFKKAVALLQSGMRPADVSMAVSLLNQACVPPLEDSEVHSILASAARYDTPTAKREVKRRNPLYWLQVFVLEDIASQELRLMTDYQYGWFSRLRDAAWLKAGILPDDTEQLFKLAGASSRKKFRQEMHIALFEFSPMDLNGQRVLVNRSMSENWSAALDKWLQTKAARAARDNKPEEQAA